MPKKPETRIIHCCGCGAHVNARLTDGSEVYPHRGDLRSIPFWICDACGNWVGCHHKTANRTAPLGCIPTPELKVARGHIHKLIDPAWMGGEIGRKQLYAEISRELGREFHTAQIRSIDEARVAYRAARIVLSRLSRSSGQ